MKSFARIVREELVKTPETESTQEARNAGFNLLVKNNLDSTSDIDWYFLQTEECRRAFLRGAFLASGYITDPNKGYHAEIVVKFPTLRKSFSKLLEEFALPIKWVSRESKWANAEPVYVFYFKNSEVIADLLGIIGANKSMLEFLNVKVEKEDNNNLNRRVNSETTNLDRTVIASIKQIENIKKLGIENIPDKYKEIAAFRLEHPGESLSEIAESLDLTKSHVNYCFNTIEKLAASQEE